MQVNEALEVGSPSVKRLKHIVDCLCLSSSHGGRAFLSVFTVSLLAFYSCVLSTIHTNGNMRGRSVIHVFIASNSFEVSYRAAFMSYYRICSIVI